MSHGKAANRLRKEILFSLIEKCGLNFCYRCGKEMSEDNFSIDHKDPWLHSDNPIELFFNLNNITFSHSVCNSSAARQPFKDTILCKHGSRTRYNKHGCRCELCKRAQQKHNALRKERGYR